MVDIVTIDLTSESDDYITLGPVTTDYVMTDSVMIDFSDIGAAQSTYTIHPIDDLILTVDNSGVNGITDWLQEREIIDRHHEEEKIRNTHSAVQYAYEQYQILLNLSREEPTPTDDSV